MSKQRPSPEQLNAAGPPIVGEHGHGDPIGPPGNVGVDGEPAKPEYRPDPAKKPDALKAARRVLSILLPFSPKWRLAIIQMAGMLCEEEA